MYEFPGVMGLQSSPASKSTESIFRRAGPGYFDCPVTDSFAAGAVDDDDTLLLSTSSKASFEDVDTLYEILQRDEWESSRQKTDPNTMGSPPNAKRPRLLDSVAATTAAAVPNSGEHTTPTDQEDAKAVARICEQLQEGFACSKMSAVTKSTTCSGRIQYASNIKHPGNAIIHQNSVVNGTAVGCSVARPPNESKCTYMFSSWEFLH